MTQSATRVSEKRHSAQRTRWTRNPLKYPFRYVSRDHLGRKIRIRIYLSRFPFSPIISMALSDAYAYSVKKQKWQPKKPFPSRTKKILIKNSVIRIVALNGLKKRKRACKICKRYFRHQFTFLPRQSLSEFSIYHETDRRNRYYST